MLKYRLETNTIYVIFGPRDIDIARNGIIVNSRRHVTEFKGTATRTRR